jgi:DNA-binding NtrC family response regulator
MTKSVNTIQTDIQNLSNILLATLDESLFFSTLSGHLQSILNADIISIYLLQEDQSAQLIVKNQKIIEGGIVLQKGEGPAGHVIRTKKPYFSNNVSRDPLFQKEAKEGIQAELSIPVVVDGIVIASLHFQMNDNKIEFSREHMTEILSILNEIKQPLVNMKMYLAAKHLNEALLKKIEQKEKQISESKSSHNAHGLYKIEEKEIIGKSTAMKTILNLADKVALTDINTLIEGEAGTGKEMIARKIHCRSIRKEAGFASIDCTSLPEVQLEKELFGEEGSFTHSSNRGGLLETINGGTLFINNVDALSLNTQSKLQRFIVEKMAFRIGGQIPFRTDVRIISATTKDLSVLVQDNLFREDLFYSLNTMNLKSPALRDRQEDIELLAINFLNSGKARHDHKSLSPCVLNALLEYSWPGNVRELQNVMERAYILADGMIVEKDHLAETVSRKQEEVIVEEEEVYNFSEMTLDELERRHICKTLDALAGNKTKTAKTLGITVKTLYNKLHSYGMITAKEA